MKTKIIKAIAVAAGFAGLLMLVGDLPEASLVHFAAVKIAGLALLWGAAKAFEKNIPEDTI